MQLTYTIPDEKAAEYIAHYVYINKNLELNDPNDPKSGLKYTDAQWVREDIIRKIRAQIVCGRNEKYNDDMTSYNVSDVT